jgi:hypothetical protein
MNKYYKYNLLPGGALLVGHLAGITGMLTAIPSYTALRVFAKQFLNNFKVVKKLTAKI